jgi:hypothetical protein
MSAVTYAKFGLTCLPIQEFLYAARLTAPLTVSPLRVEKPDSHA